MGHGATIGKSRTARRRRNVRDDDRPSIWSSPIGREVEPACRRRDPRWRTRSARDTDRCEEPSRARSSPRSATTDLVLGVAVATGASTIETLSVTVDGVDTPVTEVPDEHGTRLDPMDFHAVAEAVVDGQWIVVDPTLLAPRTTLLRIATGRDAADTAFLGANGDARPSTT